MGKNKTASWDGKSYMDYRTTDRNYRDQFENDRGTFDSEGYAEDMAYGSGSRQAFLQPLIDAGIPRDQYEYYADKAGITNVNSRNDLDQIISVYNEDERYQPPAESESKDKKDSEDEYTPPPPDPEREAVLEQDREYLANRRNMRQEIGSRPFQYDSKLTGAGSTEYGSGSDYDMRADMNDDDKAESAMDFANAFKQKLLTDMGSSIAVY